MYQDEKDSERELHERICEEAVKLVVEEGVSAYEASHQLNLPKSTLENWVRAADTTYISTGEGWLYLVAHKDLFNGEIVGYAMGERVTRNLVSQSLFRAVAAKRPAPGLLHHSDRGSQYFSPNNVVS